MLTATTDATGWTTEGPLGWEKKEEEREPVFVQHFPCAELGEDVFPELGLALR